MNEQEPSFSQEEKSTRTISSQENWYTPLTRVTTFSKYFALLLFIVLPFLGFWLGIQYAEQTSSIVSGENFQQAVDLPKVPDGVQETSTSTNNPVFHSSDFSSSNVRKQYPVLSDYNPWTYTNEKYGFSIQLPDFVRQKDIVEDDSSGEININIKDYVYSNTLAEMERNAITVLTIYPVSIDNFNREYFLEEIIYSSNNKTYIARTRHDEYSPWIYIGENNKYVFLITPGQDCATGDWCTLHDLTDEIGSTFTVPLSVGFTQFGTMGSPSARLEIKQGYNFKNDPSVNK